MERVIHGELNEIFLEDLYQSVRPFDSKKFPWNESTVQR
jgi:hypothetical protein